MRAIKEHSAGTNNQKARATNDSSGGVKRLEVVRGDARDHAAVGDDGRHAVDGALSVLVLVLGGGGHVGHGPGQVLGEAGYDALRRVHVRHADVDAAGVLEDGEGPAARGERVGDVVDVEARGVARAEADHGGDGLAHELELRHGLDRRHHPRRRRHDLLGGAGVSVLAHVHQRRPRPRNQPPRPRPGHGGRGVEATGPVRGDEELVAAQLHRAVKHHRRALGCEAELVGVGGEAGHAGHGQVEGPHGVSRGGEEGQQQ
mmetsp:Transcript_75892/g.203309  ORF Transcript_75892/g.203309 Transcript_75892/m.203309 type:complete len:259 (-) Transcript_75892:924-1700(-)